MLSNQMFDVVGQSFNALQSLGPSKALNAISELTSLFREHGIPGKVDSHEEIYKTLSDEAWEQIDGIDQKYFGGPKETDVWTNRVHLTLGIEYAKRHVQLLRKRKRKG